MNNPKVRFVRLTGIAAATLIVLSLAPGTSWILRTQLGMELRPTNLLDISNRREAYRQVYARHPRDYQVQLAHALYGDSERNDPQPSTQLLGLQNRSVERVARLQALAEQFPNEPSLYAQVLRYMTQGQITLHRDEEDQLSAVPVRHDPRAGAPVNQADFAAFDRAAATGEKLDPDNAYFPLMRAVGLYAAHHDADAVGAVLRAGQKSRYEDYSPDEVLARWRVQDEAFGARSALTDLATSAWQLFPQYAQIRDVARMTLYEAVQAETLKPIQNARAVPAALRQAGWVLGTATGGAWLGGNASSGHDVKAYLMVRHNPDGMDIVAESAYAKLGRDVGLPVRHALMHVGALMRAQSHSLIGSLVGIAVSAIMTSRPGGEPAPRDDRYDPNSKVPPEQRHRERLERYYAYLQGIGRDDEARWARAEMEAAQQAKAISQRAVNVNNLIVPYVRLGAAWAVDLLILSNMLVGLALGLAALAASRVVIRRRGYRTMARTAFVIALLLVSAAWQRHVFDESLRGYFALFSGSQSDELTSLTGWSEALALLLAGAMPLLSVLVLGVVSHCCRVPLATGIGRGLRGIAAPVACCLCLVYAGALVVTARAEAMARPSIRYTLLNEPQYLAARIGERWPGPAQPTR